jgi:hypothetical protein
MAGDLDLGLVDEPAITRGVPGRAGGVDERGCEGLHPPMHRDVVDLDAAFCEQLLGVAVGQAERRYQRTATAITPRGKR